MILIDGYAGVIVAFPFDNGSGTTAGPASQRNVGSLSHNHIAGAQRVVDVGGNWKKMWGYGNNLQYPLNSGNPLK